MVDSVFHTEEIVVKPMASKLRHIAMFSGNTILGDGSVIMIIDPNGVSQEIGTAVSGTPALADDRPSARSAGEHRRRCWCSAPAPPSPRRCRCRW